MGGAMNLLYGITDMLSIADTVVTVKQDIIIVPHGFATTYIFTEDWIKKTTIPSLYLIEDIVSAHRWESFLALNDSLKKRAVFKKNISYAGGSGYGYSESMTKTDTYTQQFDMVIDAKVAADVGITVNGIGAVGGVNVSTSYTTGKSQVNTKVNTTTSGFELYDGEALDGFTVDVKEDPVYGTPVFVTKSGQTKCPHEDNTTAREGTELFPKTNSQSNVPANSSASFTLYMNNTGSEKGDYELSVLNVTNATYGASIFAGGYSLASPIIYNLPVNTMTPVTIFITRPAGGQIYDFTGIKLRLSSQCETGPGMSDTATFDVHFTPPCSRVSISSPTINWVINQANNNILPVTVTDYDLNNPQLQEIGLQYSSNSGNTWTTLFSTFKDVISGPTIVYNWNVTGYSDGFYSLRAFSKCAGGIMNYTVGLDGVIDLHAPVAVSPLPAGGVLHTGDEISFTFNEALNPESVTVNTCKIVNPVNGVQVGASVAYLNGSNKIVFTIQPENNYFIENQYLTSMVTGVTDRYGNPLVGTASFTFLVDQGPLHWTPNSFPFSVPGPGNSAPFNFSSLLSNSSSSPVSYLLVKPGSIGSTTPSTGSLTAAGGSVTANFSTQAMSPGNPRYDTIYARTLGYPDEMVYVSFYTPTNLALSTNTNTLDVSATAGNSSFAINSNLSWKVSETATWLSATPLQGNSNKTIPLTYAENTSTSDRSAVITITSQGVLPEKTVTVTVTQTAPGVPVSVIVPAHTVASGIVECYKAQQTITAQNLVVESGGNVKLIAGTKITLQPGVHAKAGSAFHGWISATDLCGSAPSQLISGTDDQVSPQESGKEFFAQDKLFRVYPNPTTGEFTLELLKFDALSNITVNIYGMQGNKIQSAELPARKRYTFNLSDSKAGLYLIQVMNNGVTGVTRIVKQ
jgi:hypothetical protein